MGDLLCGAQLLSQAGEVCLEELDGVGALATLATFHHLPTPLGSWGQKSVVSANYGPNLRPPRTPGVAQSMTTFTSHL